MSAGSGSGSGSGGRTALAILAAVVVPASIVRLSGTTAYGPSPLFAAHLVAALPLGWALGASLGRIPNVVRVFLALTLAGLAVPVGTSATAWMDQMNMGVAGRAVFRSTLAALLIAPWPIAFAERRSVASAVAAGLVLAILPPAAYSYRIVESRTADAKSFFETGQTLKALRTIEALRDLGSIPSVGNLAPRTVIPTLRSTIRGLEAVAARPFKDDPAARMDRAFVLIQLDRLEEADALLRKSADSESLLLLASIRRNQGRTAEAERTYRDVLERSKAEPSTRARLERRTTAYDGLVDVYNAAGRFDAAGKILLEARAALPTRGAYFAFRLATHDLDQGRSFSALEWLDEAVRQDPNYAARVEAVRRRARVKTPACLRSR